MSQRLFSAIVAVVLFIGVGIFAAANGLAPALRDLFGTNFLNTLAPLTLTATTLYSFFDFIDSKVADGTWLPGNVWVLSRSAAFYTAMAAILAGSAQFWGVETQLADPQVQAAVVSFLLLVATLIYRSFSDRPAGDPETTAQKVQRLE